MAAPVTGSYYYWYGLGYWYQIGTAHISVLSSQYDPQSNSVSMPRQMIFEFDAAAGTVNWAFGSQRSAPDLARRIDALIRSADFTNPDGPPPFYSSVSFSDGQWATLKGYYDMVMDVCSHPDHAVPIFVSHHGGPAIPPR